MAAVSLLFKPGPLMFKDSPVCLSREERERERERELTAAGQDSLVSWAVHEEKFFLGHIPKLKHCCGTCVTLFFLATNCSLVTRLFGESG